MENRYTLVKVKANEIEVELKRLNRWSHEPLHEEQYEDMGAFGMNKSSQRYHPSNKQTTQ